MNTVRFTVGGLVAIAAMAIALLAFAGCTTLGCVKKPEDMLTKALDSVVVVVSRSADGSSLCSGTAIFHGPGGNIVLTCDHCVDEAKTVEVQTADGRTIAGRIYRRDSKRDLALIWLPLFGEIDPLLPVISPAKKDPGRYALLYALAAPFEQRWSASAAFLADPYFVLRMPGNSRDGARVWQLSGGFFGSGASGGAVLNDSGELVCVLEAVPFTIRRSALGDAFPLPVTAAGECVPRKDIVDFLQEAGI